MPISSSFNEHLAKLYEETLLQLQTDQRIWAKLNEEQKRIPSEEEFDLPRKDKKKKKPIVPRYYYTPLHTKLSYSYHVYTPGGINVVRVPSNLLGPNILGRAFIGTNRIEILETLSGLAFEEVKRHEINHILNPYLGEWEIRQKTKAELPFEPYFH